MRISTSIIAPLRWCHHQVQDVHTVFLSQPYFLIGSLVLDVRRVFSTAIFDQKQACSRSSPFDLLIPEPFSLWQLEKSWIFAVGRQVCKHSIFFVLHCTLCCHRLLCRNHLLLTHRTLSKDGLSTNPTGMTVSPAPESTTRGFGNGAQVFC